MVASSSDEIREQLLEIAENPSLIKEWGEKAFQSGMRNHDKKKITEMLERDFQEVLMQES